MKAAFYTLGCKVNQYESQALSELLTQNGYEIVDSRQDADIYIINSCTVTAAADQKTRQSVRRFKRSHPESIVVLTGCMPQAYPKVADSLPEADIIIGNKDSERLVSLLDSFAKFGKQIVSINEHENGEKFSGRPITCFDERTRAYVKIQDGCNRFCSYCIIPTSRGRVRSKPLEQIKSEIEKIAGNGFSEVVLVGINLSSYGQDLGIGFPEAVKVACDIPGITRVRLGSIEPDHLTDEVIDALSKMPKLCPQFHLSLQSGCDKTLRTMNRHYTADEYRSICQKLRASFSDCTLTTDVMVGFAGETEDDFNESLGFVKEIGFEKVHVFPYSVRKGTRAENFGGQVDKATKEKRCHIMLLETEKMRRDFFALQKGKTVSVLFESKTDGGYIFGHTPNYTPVKVKTDEDLSGKILDVRIVGVCDDDYCSGELI